MIEHVPHWLYERHEVIGGYALHRPIVHFLWEVHRVLKRGGLFHIITLAFPDPRCFEDPDHKAVWTIDTIRHFVGQRHSQVGNDNDTRTGLDVPFRLIHSKLNSDKLLDIVLEKP